MMSSRVEGNIDVKHMFIIFHLYEKNMCQKLMQFEEQEEKALLCLFSISGAPLSNMKKCVSSCLKSSKIAIK